MNNKLLLDIMLSAMRSDAVTRDHKLAAAEWIVGMSIGTPVHKASG